MSDGLTTGTQKLQFPPHPQEQARGLAQTLHRQSAVYSPLHCLDPVQCWVSKTYGALDQLKYEEEGVPERRLVVGQPRTLTWRRRSIRVWAPLSRSQYVSLLIRLYETQYQYDTHYSNYSSDKALYDLIYLAWKL